MAKKANSLGSVKRFGPRYGKTTKQRFAKLEIQQKATYKCPYCSYKSVNRVNSGIWNCSKCDKTFASRAYTVNKKSSKVSTDDKVEHYDEDFVNEKVNETEQTEDSKGEEE